MKIQRFFLPLVVFFAFGFANAQMINPVKWTKQVVKVSDSEANIVLTATIDATWHLFSQFTPAGGGLPTVFTYTPSSNYKLIGKASEYPAPKTVHEEVFGVDEKLFEGKVTFTQRIKVLGEKSFTISVDMAGQACNDGTCVQVEESFSIPIDGSQYNKEEKVDTAVVVVAVDTVENTVDTTQTQTTVSETKDGDKDNSSLWAIIIEAILWGFAALLTPCVFPMVPMTVSFFMKGSENKIRSRINASAFGISIVALYTLPIAAMILITYFVGGESITADIFNVLATHWIPNVIFFLIFMIFAASFFGAFEIVLPSWMTSKADAKADKGGIVGSFFMALTLVLVSFSCTGPIVGSVIVKSTQGAIWDPIITMFAFSVAFALPFTLFAFFPGWLKNLPKSGGWLNSVKVVLGFLEVALGLKFLSMADQVYHWGILDREVYLAVWIVVFTLLGFYLLGKLKFKHDSDVKFISVGRLGLSIVTFSFVIYMIPGMWGAPLKMLSGYLPPQQTLDFDMQRIVNESGGVENIKNELCEEPKYSDILDLPHNIKGYFDLDQALACAKEQNKPVFVDFTGHACVNCREMEANVWSAPEVLKRLKNDFVVVALYVDDAYRLPESDWVTSNVDGKVKKSIGAKMADIQIERYQTNAQPQYALLDAEGSDLVKTRNYNLDVDAFVKWLDEGLAEFEKRSKKE